MAPLPSLSRSPPTMPLGSCSWVNAPWLLRACDWARGRLAQLLRQRVVGEHLGRGRLRVLHGRGEGSDDVVGLGAQACAVADGGRPVGRGVERVELGLGEHRRDGGRLERCTGLAADEQHENRGPRLLQRRLREHLLRGVPTARDGEHLDARRRELGGGLLRGRATRQRLGVGVGRLQRRPDEGLAPWQRHRPAVASRDDVATAPTAVAAVVCGGVGSDGRGLRRAPASPELPVQAESMAAQASAAARARRRVAARGMEKPFSDTGDRSSTADRDPRYARRLRVPNRRRASPRAFRAVRTHPSSGIRVRRVTPAARRRMPGLPRSSTMHPQTRRTSLISGVPVAGCASRPPSSTNPRRA